MGLGGAAAEASPIMNNSKRCPEVLFLCTGNYYRSRTAEAVFNHYALAQALDVRATSRGLGLSADNKGPISPHAILWLEANGVPFDRRQPQDLAVDDLSAAHRTIAIDQTEHRVMMSVRFPEWVDRIEYWTIHDLDRTSASEALSAIERRVRALVDAYGETTPQAADS